MILGLISKKRNRFQFFLGMILGVIGLVIVLFAVFLFQDWRNEKLWEVAINTQEEPEEEEEIEPSRLYECGNKENEEDQHPPVTSNEDFYGEKTHFKFSPNKKYIAFVQNVFEKYDCDWDRYWALKLFYLQSETEKVLFVDDTRMSSYEWLSSEKIRVFHNTGTGIRAYKDISINREEPLFFKDYKEFENKPFWIIDKEYVKQVKDLEEARRMYYELLH